MKKQDWMPNLVYWGLWGIHSKVIAYVYLLICLFLGMGSVMYGFKDPLYFYGTVFFVSAYWYFYSIRWMDRHMHWDDVESS